MYSKYYKFFLIILITGNSDFKKNLKKYFEFWQVKKFLLTIIPLLTL
jgi:hypothetical protein